MEYYSHFLLEPFRDNLVHYMNQYVYDKVYNTPYRDLVPLIVANALDINIVTISDANLGPEARTIYTYTCKGAMGEILIFKSPDHYYGLFLKRKLPHLNLDICVM